MSGADHAAAALERLYVALEPLRLYALHRGSLVDRELMAYAAGIGQLESLLEQTAREAFVQTAAEEETLATLERLVGLPARAGLDTAARRELILYRMGAAGGDTTRQGMERAIRALGMEAQLLEDTPGEALEVRCVELLDPTLDLDRLKAGVLRILPAHLQIHFDIGEMTWDMFDTTETTWDNWDDIHFTWTEFDLKGHDLFTS